MEDEEEDVSSYGKMLKETRRYCKLKVEAIDRTVWRTGFGTGCRSVVRQTGE